MAHSSWFYVAYGLCLFYLLVKHDAIRSRAPFELALLWYLGSISIGIVTSIVTGLGMADPTTVYKGASFTLVMQGLSWACVALSLVMLRIAMAAPEEREKPKD